MDDKEIVYPRKANIREEWHWVRQGIDEVLHLDRNLTYRPEDVYASVINNDSELWVHPNFFTVLTIGVDEYTGDRTLVVWLMWAKERGGANAHTFTEFYENLGRHYGCTRIEGHGTQMPFIAHLEREVGWTVSSITFGKDLIN